MKHRSVEQNLPVYGEAYLFVKACLKCLYYATCIDDNPRSSVSNGS